MTPWFTSVFRRLWRVALLLALALVLIGSIAPFVNAASYSGRIERALEAALGRKVAFQEVHFTLFTGPGFSLRDVTIQEDPRYGLEPFAHVPRLEARLRLGRLLLGHIAFSSLVLDQPSLNLVKRNDGSWNVVELVDRVSAPSHRPIDFFPAVEVSDGRIDFKMGMRKTTLYVTDADVSIYPESSGKLYIQFSGSPARTDRAGRDGFGHLRGTANWYLKPASATANQLEAAVTLDPSNLSDLTTLFEGEDAGVHGTVSSQLRIEGPATALRLAGEVHLADVHRWDLLPSSGQDWRIQYKGDIDLVAHSFEVHTLPTHAGDPTPVLFQLRSNHFLQRPDWSVLATFDKAPAADLLPLSRRMGLVSPDDLQFEGTLDGVIGYSSRNGLSGGVAINKAIATLPNLAPLRASVLNVSISPDRIRFEPTSIETPTPGALQVGGDYDLSSHRSAISLTATDFPVAGLKHTFSSWFGPPPALAAFRSGTVNGHIVYARTGADLPSWAGQFRFEAATLALPGLATPLTDAQGRVNFDDRTFDLDRFSAALGTETLAGNYHYDDAAKRPERLHIDAPSMDLAEIETALEPTLRAQGLLARLGVSRRSIPAWLESRNLQGDISIGQFSVNGTRLGKLETKLLWAGTSLQFSTFRLSLPQGVIQADGALNVAFSSPRYNFNASVTGFPWRGGVLGADGRFQTSGTGVDSLQHLRADGAFSGQDVALSPEDLFNKVSGSFQFSFVDGWPSLRLANVQVSEGDEAWTGVAASQSDGKLVIDLESAGRQRRLISTLEPETPTAFSAPRPLGTRPIFVSLIPQQR